MEAIKVLIVDYDSSFCEQASTFLNDLGGYSVSKASSTDEAMSQITQGTLDAVISGHRTPILDGLRLLKTMREKDPSPAFILLIGKGEEEIIVQALNEDADSCLLRNGEPGSCLQDLERMIRKSVTKRKAERSLHERERRYRLLTEKIIDVIWMFDLDNMSLSYISPSVQKLRGISCEEARLEPLDLALDPDSLSRLRSEMPARIRRFRQGDEGMRTIIDVVRQPRSDGTWVAVEVSTTLVEDERGEVHEMLGISRDLTKRIQQERELKESQRKLMTVMSNLPGMAFRCVNDQSFTMEFVSYGCQQLTGHQSWELLGNVGTPFASLILPEDMVAVREEVQAAIDARRSFHFEYRIKRKDGKLRWVMEQGQGVFSETGELLALEGFIADVTESKETLGKLEMANKKLGLLTSITRHDALNMLTVIRGQVEMGRMRTRDHAITEALNGIDRMACRIQRTIDFTSQYQQMQASEPTWQRLDETVRKAIDDHPPGEGLSAINAVGSYEILADPMFSKVFHNLLDNSVRHGNAVHSVHVFTDYDRDGLKIIYEDDGQGIPVEQKALIFERGVGRNFGFGLFLSREIFGITGITISEEGTPGRGARFVMRVPLSHCRRL